MDKRRLSHTIALFTLMAIGIVSTACVDVCGQASLICGAEPDPTAECTGSTETFAQCIVDANDCTDESLCGNGALDAGEACDGSDLAGQDCLGQGFDGGTLACAVDCTFDTSECTGGPTCGNGIIETGEACDDSNSDPGDGCDGACGVENGHTCAGEPSICTQNCGNGTLDAGEDCDGTSLGGEDCISQGFDAGTLACGADCAFDTSECAGGPACGNGIVETGEACDDGDLDPGNGCDANCLIENGWGCIGQAPSTCTENCGDGVIVGTEDCDDGGGAPGDGCDADCAVEPGWGCTGEPSVCQETCGNGSIDPGEDCDGSDLAGEDCVSRGLGGGTLACMPDCAFDTSGCAGLCTPTGDEICDGEDNDCNGVVDDAACSVGESCTAAEQCTTGFCDAGVCSLCSSTDQCQPDHYCDYFADSHCRDVPECTPSTDVCDGLDNDCDGQVDNGFSCYLENGETCTDNSQCNSKRCVATLCEPCVSDGDCLTGFYCDATARCSSQCEDYNACTIDSGNLIDGCMNIPAVGAGCDDFNGCTQDDFCDGFRQCRTANPVQCPPGEICDDLNGQCRNPCDDGNTCTDDIYNPNTGGCTWEPVGEGQPCDDNNACTLGSICTDSVCVPESEVQCSGGLFCEPVSGVCTDFLCLQECSLRNQIRYAECFEQTQDPDLCNQQSDLFYASCLGSCPPGTADANTCTTEELVDDVPTVTNDPAGASCVLTFVDPFGNYTWDRCYDIGGCDGAGTCEADPACTDPQVCVSQYTGFCF